MTFRDTQLSVVFNFLLPFGSFLWLCSPRPQPQLAAQPFLLPFGSFVIILAHVLEYLGLLPLSTPFWEFLMPRIRRGRVIHEELSTPFWEFPIKKLYSPLLLYSAPLSTPFWEFQTCME